jgi:hypothetical protein
VIEPSSIVSLSIALIALAVAVWTWWRTQGATRFALAHGTLMEINRIVLEHPEFNSQAWCEESLDHSDERRKYQYDVFAQIVWDYLERIYFEFGERGLVRAPLYGAVVYLASLHRAWLIKNQKSFPYYATRFVTYVDKLPRPV